MHSLGCKNRPCHEHALLIVALKRFISFKYVKPVNGNLYYAMWFQLQACS